jgi:hypothetical protein
MEIQIRRILCKEEASEKKEERDAILLDETKIRRNGKMAYVCVCLYSNEEERGHLLELKQEDIVSVHNQCCKASTKIM